MSEKKSKKFQLVNFDGQGPSTSCTAKTDWKFCIICQEHMAEVLRCPLQSNRADKGNGYTSLAKHLTQFNELGQFPSTLQIGRLDEGHGIEAAMFANKAQYHQTYRLKYNETKLKRTKKRAYSESPDQQSEGKVRRSQPSWTPEMRQDICFFCRQATGNEGLREATTFELDHRVHAAATMLLDTELIG